MDHRAYTYIVTGCTGYVGNQIAKRLMADGCRVVGLAQSEEKVARVFGADRPTLVLGDIRRREDVARLFQGEGPFVVFHTVALVSIGEVPQALLYGVNVEGTRNLVEEALLHPVYRYFQITSTDALPRDAVLTDAIDYTPSPERKKPGYGQSKSMADAIALQAARERGLPASLLMIASVLGPGDYSRSHMTQMLCHYIEGSLPASVAAGYNHFDIRDLTAVLPAMVAEAEAGQTYLFANRRYRIGELLAIVREMLGTRKLPTLPLFVAYLGLPFLSLKSRLFHERPLYTAAALSSLRANSVFPIEKVKKAFGYSPRPIEETVRDHVQFLFDEGLVAPNRKKH